MYCNSCGAPMTLLRERDYFHCEYCGSYHFPGPNLDGLRLLGEAPDRIKCPVCRTTLHVAALDDSMRGHQCVKCRGILLGRFDFRDALFKRRARAAEPPAAPIPLDRTQLTRSVQCPRCSGRMETHPYLGPGNIVIDTCNVCNLIWLDGAELQRAVNAPGGDRGSSQQRHVTGSIAHTPSGYTSPTYTPPRYVSPVYARNRNKRERGNGISLADLLDALF